MLHLFGPFFPDTSNSENGCRNTLGGSLPHNVPRDGTCEIGKWLQLVSAPLKEAKVWEGDRYSVTFSC